jgi:hypothetical protein
MFRKELFNFQDKLYFIERRVREKHIKPEFIDDLRKYWNCDNVVRQMYQQTNENYLLFLVEIPEAEILPD